MSTLDQITSRSSSVANQPAAVAADQSVCIPEKQRSELGIALLLFAGTALYLYLFRRCTTMDPDEGIILQGAHRILNGEVLYRDFFSFFTPGSYYLLALLFRIFADSFLVARSVLVFLGAVYSVITYLLARRVCSRNTALFIAVIVTLTTLPYRFMALHNWDSTFWACLAVYCAVRLFESPRWTWALGVGSLTSITFLFEQSKGAGLALGLGAGFVALALLGKRPVVWRWRETLALIFGLLWPVLICLAYFGSQHALSPMLADWFWPLKHYSLANRVPYGYQNWSDNARHQMFGSGPWGVRLVAAIAVSPCLLIPLVPLLAFGWLCYWLWQCRRRAVDEKGTYYILISAAVCGLLVSVIVVRTDIIHFFYLQPLFFLMLAWLVDGRDVPGRIFKIIHPLFNVYVGIAFLALGMPLLLRVTNARISIQTRRGTITVPKDDTVIPYVQAHVAAGETFLVYPYLPLYSYLTDTVSPSRYEYFQPGMNTPEQNREIISQLAAKHVRAVLFEPAFAEVIPVAWPGTPVSDFIRDPVADSILRDYRVCRVLSSSSDKIFLFMVRKESAGSVAAFQRQASSCMP